MKTLLQTAKFLALGLGLFISASCASKNQASNKIPAGNQKMVAIMEVKEPIDGVCDNDKVYALEIMSILDPTTTNAECAVSKAQMEKKLNEEVVFLKDNPKFKGEGMLSIIVNCKGEVVRCEIDNKSKSPEFDAQILAVFKTFISWTAGTFDGKPVDSVQLFSYSVKDGVLEM